MNRSTLLLLGSLILLLNCSAAHGQGSCGSSLQPHFSIYYSISRDGMHIYTSVTTQGYVSILNGCNMGSATHKAGAYNALSGNGGWSYSASGCPTCYFSVTNNENIDGVPGTLYPFSCDGASICSIVGTFWSDAPACPSIPGCLVPETESTADKGFNGGTYREQFEMTVSDTAQDSFAGYYVQEVTTSPGSNTCYWSSSGLQQHPGTQGSQWQIDINNQWGFDSIGWDLPDLDTIVNDGPSNGITFPCVTTIHQGMQIMCNANTYWQYQTDDITISVDSDHTEELCRAGVCSPWQPFSYRRNERQSTWWARILNAGDTLRTVKEAR